MRIASMRIQNYRSILDSGTLTFSPAFNLIVGANNVGKSSLLLCLAAKFGAEPHKSIHVLPTRDEPLNPISRVDLTGTQFLPVRLFQALLLDTARGDPP